MLRLLDSVVVDDRFAPGFRGTLCVGVRGAYQTMWWIADFGETTTTRFDVHTPEEFDVALGFSCEQADALVSGEDLRDDGLMTGDRRVLDAFLLRYLGKMNCISVRLAKFAPTSAGFVAKGAHPTDGRSWILSLTAAGKRRARRLQRALDAHAAGLLAHLPAAERARVADVLQLLRDALEEDAGVGP